MSEDERSEAKSSPAVERPRKLTPAERIEELNDIDKVCPHCSRSDEALLI
jgi:hypothetical protein